MDFFTVITANFRILYCLFLIRYNHRELIHLNCTEHPTCEWIMQQLREAFPDRTGNQHVIFDNDVNCVKSSLPSGPPRDRAVSGW